MSQKGSFLRHLPPSLLAPGAWRTKYCDTKLPPGIPGCLDVTSAPVAPAPEGTSGRHERLNHWLARPSSRHNVNTTAKNPQFASATDSAKADVSRTLINRLEKV